MPTGEIEIDVTELNVLNKSELPPFTIEEETDGGEELRMKYRYLDLRRNSVKNNIILRHRVAQEVRKYMDSIGFIEVETPVLIKSTPEGARDFVVPKPYAARNILCSATVATDAQAAADGCRLR
ncbi:MAG: hypothetical protein MZV63_29155 [Marinilabiliales bacterium]|nr:hypothetical protein [Marinilabiliales bacterium]